MTALIWDNIGERSYETGLDRGVLYLPDGSAVPWNGLTSIIEKSNKELTSVYYDGAKVNELVSLSEFSAVMKAVTYPEEFVELEGLQKARPGVFFGDQKPKSFGLCYRTQLGNDLEGDSVGYKLHVVYNVTAVPNDKVYASLAAQPSLVEFEWNLSTVPEEIPLGHPTSHIIVDSRNIDPVLLSALETKLYGSDSVDASLISMSELIDYIVNWYLIAIVDNGDGTWTASSDIEGLIVVNEIDDSFTIPDANATFLDLVTYEISDTLGD